MEDSNLTGNLPESFSEIETLIQQPNDVTLQVGNKSVPAHRKVLEMWSPVMKALLSEKWSQPEGEQENAVCELGVEFVDVDIVDDLLNFFYTSNVTLTPKNAQSLCIAANYLNVSLLESDCDKYFANRIDKHNFFDLLDLANRFELKILRKGCLYHLYRNKDSLLANREPPASFSDDEWKTILKDVEGLQCKLYFSSCFMDHFCHFYEAKTDQYDPITIKKIGISSTTSPGHLNFSQSGDKIIISNYRKCQVFDLQANSLLPEEFEKPEGWRPLSSSTMNGNLYILGTSEMQSGRHLLHRCHLEPRSFRLLEVANESAPVIQPKSRFVKLVELNGRLYTLTNAEYNGNWRSKPEPSSFTVYERITGDSEAYKSTTLATPIYHHADDCGEQHTAVTSHAGRIFVISKAGFESYCPVRNKWTCLGINNYMKPSAMISVLGKLWVLGKNLKTSIESESFEFSVYELEWLYIGGVNTPRWNKVHTFEDFKSKMSFFVANEHSSQDQ